MSTKAGSPTMQGGASLKQKVQYQPKPTEADCNCQAPCQPCRCNPIDEHRKRITAALGRFYARNGI